MTNRLVLGAIDDTYGLRISRPGFDVMYSGLAPEQLAFDSRWNTMGRVYYSGQSRVYQGYYDMLGSYLYTNFYIPSGYPGIPIIIGNFRPEGNVDVKVTAALGDVILGAYDPNVNLLTVAPAYSYLGNVAANQGVGWFNYHFLRY